MTDAASAAPAGTEQTAAPAETSQPTESSNQPWHSTLDADTKNWAASKGFTKDNAGDVVIPLLNSYRNAEKLISQVKGDPDRIVLMPKDFANEKEVREYYDKIGVPKDVGGYGLPANDGETELDDMLKGFAEVSLKHGAPKGAVEQQVAYYRNYIKGIQERNEAEFQASKKAQFAEFESESGPALEQNRSYAAAAMQKFPELDEFAEVIERHVPGGAKKLLSYMVKVGQSIGEHKAIGVGNDPSGGGMSVDAAKEALGKFNLDATKRAALTNESHPAHKAVKEEFMRLNRLAVGMK